MTHFQSRVEKNKVSPEQKSESFCVSRGKESSEPGSGCYSRKSGTFQNYRVMLRAGSSIQMMSAKK